MKYEVCKYSYDVKLLLAAKQWIWALLVPVKVIFVFSRQLVLFFMLFYFCRITCIAKNIITCSGTNWGCKHFVLLSLSMWSVKDFFVSKPLTNSLKKLKHTELVEVASYYGLTISSSMKKMTFVEWSWKICMKKSFSQMKKGTMGKRLERYPGTQEARVSREWES